MKSGLSPRVYIPSVRAINKMAGWCANYEFEDIVASVDHAEIHTLTPTRAFVPVDWFVQRLLWRPGVKHVARHVNPGLEPQTLTHDYDVLFFVCMNLFELPYLNAIRGWRERCKTAVCYLVESYGGASDEYEFHLNLLRQFDHVCSGLQGSVEAIERVIGQKCHYVPFGVDTLRFTPFPKPPPRSIDVYSLGRRVEWTHQALLRLAAEREIFYIYDTIPGKLIRPADYRQHRDLVANLSKRSRHFICYPAKVDDDNETRGQSEAGARYYEGAAAGALLLGRAPTGRAFLEEFDWPDSVINVPDEAALLSWLEECRKNPERIEAMCRRNAVEGLRRYDWASRWRQILEIAQIEPDPRLLARERRLAELAELGANHRAPQIAAAF